MSFFSLSVFVSYLQQMDPVYVGLLISALLSLGYGAFFVSSLIKEKN